MNYFLFSFVLKYVESTNMVNIKNGAFQASVNLNNYEIICPNEEMKLRLSSLLDNVIQAGLPINRD